MKTRTYLILTIVLFIGIGCNGQTPEQKKAVADIERMKADMLRKQDSLMNTPEMKEMMKRVKTMQVDAGAKNRDERAAQKKPPRRQNDKSYQNPFMISSGNTKKFENWKFGAADLCIVKPRPYGQPLAIEHKLGAIAADGSFDFTLPTAVKCENEITDYLIFTCQNSTPAPATQYGDPNTKMRLQGALIVVQDGKRIGNLSLASSIIQEQNNSPNGMYRGEKGYRMEWWFAEKATSAKADCPRIFNNDREIRNSIGLDFKPGWNLMKIEVAESYDDQLYKTKTFEIVPAIPQDAKWIFHEIRL